MKVKLINKEIEIVTLDLATGFVFAQINFIERTQGIQNARIYWEELMKLGVDVSPNIMEDVKEALGI